MSYTKDPRGYPPAFEALVRAAAIREVRIPCLDAKDAKRMEGRLHAYFGVLHRSVAKDKSYLELDNLSRRVKIKAVGAELVAIPRDMEADNSLILAALGQPSPMAGDATGAVLSPEMAEMFAKALTTPDSGL